MSRILDLLATRHSKDVFVPECKDGPTHTAAHLRMDAWAMRRSWSHPDTFGYEIKLFRSDFLRDTKWPGYLPLCNYLYFVAPAGVIEKSEVPEQCGLLQPTSTMSSLRTIKRAPRREVEIPESLFRYVLMSRAQIVAVGEFDTVAYWRGWLENRERQRELGHSVSRRLRQLYAENVERVRQDVMQMEIRCERADEAMRVLREMGIDLDHVSHWGIRNRIRETLGEDLLDRLRQNALETLNLLNRVQPEKKERQMVDADA